MTSAEYRVPRPDACARWLLAALCAAPLSPALAQTPSLSTPSSQATQTEEPLRIFLDCADVRCDFDFLRTEITFVSYVRDRRDADVHILVTAQPTGGGGREMTLKFIGLTRFAGRDDTLRYVSRQTDTDDEIRRGLASTLKLGLVRYVAETPLAEQLQIIYVPLTEQPATQVISDPWNYWVFRIRMNMFYNGERSNTSKFLSGNVSANRTTENWRISLSTNVNYRESRFRLSDDSTFTSISRTFGFNGLATKSLDEDHWSAAVRASTAVSTFLNLDLATRLAPGVEYDFFPYSESTRRKLTFQYTIGVNTLDYARETIFDKMSDTLLDETLIVSLDVKQPWGQAGASVEASHYLNDLSKHRLVLFGDLEVRIFRGLSLNVNGSASRIRDQVYLEKGEATTEEILVRQRQLATSYRYSFSFGVVYTFGSIYNNIVNPRFGGSSGGSIFSQ